MKVEECTSEATGLDKTIISKICTLRFVDNWKYYNDEIVECASHSVVPEKVVSVRYAVRELTLEKRKNRLLMPYWRSSISYQ